MRLRDLLSEEECIDLLCDKIAELSVDEIRLYHEALKVYRIVLRAPESTRESTLSIVNSWPVVKELKSVRGDLRRFKAQYKRIKYNEVDKFREKKELARSIQIVDIFPQENLRRGRHLCPLHNDTHPDFKIYPTNTWYCFACNKGGDVIQFVKEWLDCDFKEAVEFLTSRT